MAQKDQNQKKSVKPDGKKGGNSPKFPTWSIFVLFFVLLLAQVLFFSPDTGNRIKYSKFLEHVENGYVSEITITNGVDVTGVYSDKAISDGIINRPAQEDSNNLPFSTENVEDFKKFRTTMLRGDEIRPVLDSNAVEYDVRIEEDWFSGIFVWLIPIALLIVIWIFIFRKMNPGQQVLNIGKNKASLYDQQKETKVTFEDVAGLQEAKAEVEEVVEFLKNPQKFTKLGGVLPKGVLLVGPPGTGKTLLAKATAGEASVPFFSLSGSDFVEMFVGVGAARVRDLFKQAKEKAPCIIFIDEIDSIGRTRGRGMAMGSNDERENTLNQLLSEMDGFNSDKGVILMAATNRPDILDSALLRPGRFDRQIMIDKPDLNGRVEILRVHTKKLKLSDNIDLRVLASQTPGFAGADLANLCNEAALLAARREKNSIEMEDFQDSIEKVIAGLERKNKLISPDERKIVAYHEAGHAVVGWFLEHTDPVLKVSIVPRGLAALGYTLQTPLEERFLMTTEELNDKICALLGGRVAEEIIFGRISTGAQNDLERITTMAFAMVAEYGMSEKLGYISLKDSQNPENSYGFNKKYSEQTSEQIDKEVRKIIDLNHDRTIELLKKHKDELEKLAEALLEREVLDHHALRDLLGDRPHGKYPDGIFEPRSDSKKNGVQKEDEEKSDVADAEIVESEDTQEAKEETKNDTEDSKA
ncbi:MAG: ATP-dependent zinc metalloprotease FtsH [Gracilimonas sp.]|uniref:ATP-dependent zinc metalloprotease FtsH n=1 Tax=Gracilimonas TaxID=649462 RepID=UPI001B27ABAB|nr:ATP-dependent zinc metalloprotease FtsH [Gracilimonas sp.]MBO6585916.1 ATP-dependent zinc metalloprotease FtsH [Gracilimonas sp.]MBO6616913.1 ATP-dependent zinc metalloprotease FtsH [Gracilimonas sp.]